MAHTRRAHALAALALTLTLTSCPGPRGADCSPTATRTDIRDLTSYWYLFASQVNFAAFDPADPSRTPDQFLKAIVDSAGGPDAGRNFSYLTTQAASSQFFKEGKSQGYGFNYAVDGDVLAGTARFLLAQVLGDDPTALVADQSPAFKAGFARGDELQAVALAQADLDLPASQLPAILQASATTTPGALDAALGSGSDVRPRWFRLLKAGAATPVTATAARAVYAISPVPNATAPITFDVPAVESDTGAPKKVGYLALRSFILPAEPQLKTAFAALQPDVTDLIVDLRYDGGGRLEVAATFLDLMRAGTSPELLFARRNRAQRSSQDWLYLSAGEPSAIAVRRVAFIVGPGTASASELLPFAMAHFIGAEVALVGGRSYGKPVGQYSFSSASCTTEYVILSFQLEDAGGVRAQYFAGLPDAAWTAPTCAAADDLAHPRGDAAESATGAALQWVKDKTCAGGPIAPPPALARLSRAAPAAVVPEPAEPTLAQRHLPGLR